MSAQNSRRGPTPLLKSLPPLRLHPLPAQRASRALASRLTLGPYRASVDKDMRDAGSRQGRLGKRRAVDHGLGIEDAKIGVGAGTHDAAPAEAEPRRRQPGHLAHRHFQPEQPDFAAVMPEDSRERPPQP